MAPVLATSLYNALISGYVELGRIQDAEEMFTKMPDPDVVSWNTCHARAGRMDRAKAPAGPPVAGPTAHSPILPAAPAGSSPSGRCAVAATTAVCSAAATCRWIAHPEDHRGRKAGNLTGPEMP